MKVGSAERVAANEARNFLVLKGAKRVPSRHRGSGIASNPNVSHFSCYERRSLRQDTSKP